MQSSLSFEIIYTVLNGVVQQLQNSDKSLMVRKKANEIKKLKKMVNDTREHGSFQFNLDYYEEFIYKMDKNEIRNLD